MARESAGIVVYHLHDGRLEVLLAHPGGPYWQRKDLGAWSIPKGERDEGETPQTTACRELAEEVGIVVAGPLVGLGSTTQRAGKLVHAWGYEAEFDPQELASNLFQMEWPPRSGRMAEFPEIDRVAWFSPEEAAEKLNPAQVVLIQRLVEQILGP